MSTALEISAAPEAQKPETELEIDRRVRSLLQSKTYRPPSVPVVAVELMRISRQEDVEMRKIVALLEQDPLLTAQALKIAQSALYAGRGKIRTIHDAVMRLGLRILSDVVLEAAMNLRVFRAGPYAAAMERVRRHSVVTAHAARTVSQFTPVDGEYGFVCGLLHDVGIAAILLAVADLPGDATGRKVGLDPLWPAIDRLHAEAGAQLAATWNLPEAVRASIAEHHTAIPRVPSVLSLVIVAEEFANEFGVRVKSERKGEASVDGRSEEARKAAFASLGVDKALAELIRGELRQIVPFVQ